MSYLAGCLLLHLETEFETFKAFANLMNKEESLFHFYSFSMDKVNDSLEILPNLSFR